MFLFLVFLAIVSVKIFFIFYFFSEKFLNKTLSTAIPLNMTAYTFINIHMFSMIAWILFFKL